MDIRVSASAGQLRWDKTEAACALGRSGTSAAKIEGDGTTPLGRFALRQVFWRPDRVDPPVTALPTTALTADMGWCDDPLHGDYNRFVHLPHPASCERLWRDDSLYDLIVVLGYNDDPPVAGMGSAIFLHIRPADGGPTQGCVALERTDLTRLLAAVGSGDSLIIEP